MTEGFVYTESNLTHELILATAVSIQLNSHYMWLIMDFIENHDYCYVEMPKEDNKTLKYNHGEKSVRTPFVIYADLECLPEKINTCHNNPEKSSTTKSIHPLAIHCLHAVRLIQKKISLIVIEVKILLIIFVKI